MFESEHPDKRNRSRPIVTVFVLVLVLAIALYMLAGEGQTLWRNNQPVIGGDINVEYGSGEPLTDMIPSDFSSVVDKIGPAVVRIVVQRVDYWHLQPVQSEGAGTGVIIDPQGYIITNNHVVENAQSVDVYLSDGSQFSASIVDPGSNVETDLALLKITAQSSLPYATFLATDKEIAAGQWVIAIGYAFNIGGDPTVSEGIVSAVGRSIQLEDGTILSDVLQTTAAINSGNSGGPLVNLAGEIVGVNTAVVSGAENFGFAISRSTVIAFVQPLVT